MIVFLDDEDEDEDEDVQNEAEAAMEEASEVTSQQPAAPVPQAPVAIQQRQVPALARVPSQPGLGRAGLAPFVIGVCMPFWMKLKL